MSLVSSVPSSGITLGRYSVHDRIAVGGMASVHFGRLSGIAGFSRLVAIKRLHDQFARDPKFVAMLLDEARLVALVRHPNVLPTLEVIADGDALAIVMDYVVGESIDTLSDLLAARKACVPLGMAVSLIIQTLQGLHAAHEVTDASGRKLEIVHRDVSPQNVLVGTDGVARILDFGVARAAVRLQGTETGELKGKFAYMSPEQLSESAIDRRSDLFAVGVMLWELLTGTRLFYSTSPAATVSNILNKTVVAPSRLGQGSRALDAVVLRALERDPARRYATAEELASALEDVVRVPRLREVGKWVSEVAAVSLAKRAATARKIEMAESSMREAVTSSPELARVLASVGAPRHEGDVTEAGDGTSARPVIVGSIVPTLVDRIPAPRPRESTAITRDEPALEPAPASTREGFAESSGVSPRLVPAPLSSHSLSSYAPESSGAGPRPVPAPPVSSHSLSTYTLPPSGFHGLRLKVAAVGLLVVAAGTLSASIWTYATRPATGLPAGSKLDAAPSSQVKPSEPVVELDEVDAAPGPMQPAVDAAHHDAAPATSAKTLRRSDRYGQ